MSNERGLLGAVIFGVNGFWFLIGLIAYAGDVQGAFNLGVYSATIEAVSLLFLIPIGGFILWILGTFIWKWPIFLASYYSVPSMNSILPLVVWYIMSIIFLVVGCMITIAIVVSLFEEQVRGIERGLKGFIKSVNNFANRTPKENIIKNAKGSLNNANIISKTKVKSGKFKSKTFIISEDDN